MDIIGWNINGIVPAQGVPAPVDPELPANGATDVSLEPTLQWDPNSNTDTVSVFVYESGHHGDENFLAFEARDLPTSTTTAVIPAGSLAPNTTYEWFVTAVNSIAFAYSETWTFTTAGGPCNIADVAVPFGVLNFDDTLAFLVAFDAMDPSADLAPAFGVFDFDDILAHLTAFSEGCP